MVGQAASAGNQLIPINTRFFFALDWQSVFHRKSIASVLQYDNIFGIVKKNKKSIIDRWIRLNQLHSGFMGLNEESRLGGNACH